MHQRPLLLFSEVPMHNLSFFHVRISWSFTTDKFSSLFYNCFCSLFGKPTVTMPFPIISAKIFVVLNVAKSCVVFYLLWKIFALFFILVYSKFQDLDFFLR